MKEVGSPDWTVVQAKIDAKPIVLIILSEAERNGVSLTNGATAASADNNGCASTSGTVSTPALIRCAFTAEAQRR